MQSGLEMRVRLSKIFMKRHILYAGQGWQKIFLSMSINTNSKQYKVAAKDHLAALMEEEAMMTPEQRLLYELMGGHEECDAEL